MGATPQIDYNALAKQAGAISSQKEPDSGQIDYDALAKQAGAVSSQRESGTTSGAEPRIPLFPNIFPEGIPVRKATATLPWIGGAVGGALGAPGVVTGVGGAAIGGVAGRGLEDILNRAAGLQPEQKPGPQLSPTLEEVQRLGEAGATQGALNVGGQLAGAAVKRLAAPIGEWLESRALGQAADEWRRINAAIGARPKAIFIGKGAETLEDAATMPARGLEKIGLDSNTLAKMNPLEQGAEVKPHLMKAGQAIEDAVAAAGAKGITVDVEKPAFDAIESIKNPQAQAKALDSMIDLFSEKGIANPSAATPAQARELRLALKYGARFGPNADMSSLGQIRAGLYRSVTGSLHDAVPGLEDLDQHYSDLRSAADAIQARSKIWAVRQPPTFWQNLPPALKQGLPWALGAVGGAGAGSLIYKLSKIFGGD